MQMSEQQGPYFAVKEPPEATYPDHWAVRSTLDDGNPYISYGIFGEDESSEAFCRAQHMNAAYVAGQASAWVSVEDGLPNSCDEVWVYLPGEPDPVMLAQYIVHVGKWWIGEEIKPTHWRPRKPQPPQPKARSEMSDPIGYNGSYVEQGEDDRLVSMTQKDLERLVARHQPPTPPKGGSGEETSHTAKRLMQIAIDRQKEIESKDACIADMQATIDRLTTEARKYYNADGSYELLESPEAVVERRKADAKRLDRLRGAAKSALHDLTHTADGKPKATDNQRLVGKLLAAICGSPAALTAEEGGERA